MSMALCGGPAREVDPSQVKTRCRQNTEGEGPLSKALNPKLLRGPCYEVGTHAGVDPRPPEWSWDRLQQLPVYKTILLRCNKSIKQFGIFSTNSHKF